MASWKGEGGRETRAAAASDSSSSALTFVSLPLTPPGKHLNAHSFVEMRSTGSSAGASHLEYSSYPPSSLLASSYAYPGRSPYGSSPAIPADGAQFQFVSEKQQSRILSSTPLQKPSFLSRTTPRDAASLHPFTRMHSVVSNAMPASGSGTSRREDGKILRKNSDEGSSTESGFLAHLLRPGNRPSKRLLVLIVLNLAYSATELLIGLLTRRIGLVSDAFHLSFGCGVLTFSLFAMTWADRPPDKAYTYGHRRLEVLAAFTNAGGSG